MNTSIRVDRDLLERYRRVAKRDGRGAGTELRLYMQRRVDGAPVPDAPAPEAAALRHAA